MRNKERNDYLTVPFPRLNGETHPALVALREQAELLSLKPYGLDTGVGPYLAALLIDRDMRLRPEAYPGQPPLGLWFPPAYQYREPQAAPLPGTEGQAPEGSEERVRNAARSVAKKWRRDDEDE